MENSIVNKLPFRKDLERGQHETFVKREGQKVAITQWKDSKAVKFITNYSATEASDDSYTRRGHNEPTPMPRVARDYRGGMGHVDTFDRNKKLYTTKRTVNRWWLTLFFFLLDAVVINSWRIFLHNNEGLKPNEKTVCISSAFCSTHSQNSRSTFAPFWQLHSLGEE